MITYTLFRLFMFSIIGIICLLNLVSNLFTTVDNIHFSCIMGWLCATAWNIVIIVLMLKIKTLETDLEKFKKFEIDYKSSKS